MSVDRYLASIPRWNTAGECFDIGFIVQRLYQRICKQKICKVRWFAAEGCPPTSRGWSEARAVLSETPGGVVAKLCGARFAACVGRGCGASRRAVACSPVLRPSPGGSRANATFCGVTRDEDKAGRNQPSTPAPHPLDLCADENEGVRVFLGHVPQGGRRDSGQLRQGRQIFGER